MHVELDRVVGPSWLNICSFCEKTSSKLGSWMQLKSFYRLYSRHFYFWCATNAGKLVFLSRRKTTTWVRVAAEGGHPASARGRAATADDVNRVPVVPRSVDGLLAVVQGQGRESLPNVNASASTHPRERDLDAVSCGSRSNRPTDGWVLALTGRRSRPVIGPHSPRSERKPKAAVERVLHLRNKQAKSLTQ